ncbi:GSCOCG00010357001-RA-CDS, partial [Cotesia congregata]
SGAPYTWILDINAYPLPELHWVHPQGNSIPLQAKFRSFQVNDEKFSLDFTKTQFTIDDLGTHTIVAKSSDIQKTVTFKVLAHTSPKVMEVKQNEACLAKEATIFECQAKGYPVSEITWNCVDDKGVIENDAEFMVLKTDPKEFEVSSVVEVKKCPQRSVVCKAHNKNGDNSMTKQISNQAPAQGTDQSGSDGCPLVEKPKKNENVNPPGGDLSQKKTEVLPKIVEIEPIKKTYKLFETVKLSCQASGEPRPTITWEYWNHHNELVQNVKNTSEDPKATSDETLVTSVATIQIVTPGHVKCKAENKLGKDSKVEKIDIETSQIEGQHSSGQPPAATIPVTGGKGPTNSVVEATTKKAEASQIEGQHSSGQPPAATIPVT